MKTNRVVLFSYSKLKYICIMEGVFCDFDKCSGDKGKVTYQCQKCNKTFHEKCSYHKNGVCVNCLAEKAGVKTENAPKSFSIEAHTSLEEKEEMAKKYSSNPNFLLAMKMIPNSEVQKLRAVVPTESEYTDNQLRFQIAIIRWQNPICNNAARGTDKQRENPCPNPYGKRFAGICVCGNVYCSRKCFAMSWITHKKDCQPIDKSQLVSKDVAERRLTKAQKCGNSACNTVEINLHFCEKCYLVQYCSSICEEENRSEHEQICCNPDGPTENGPQQIMLMRMDEKQTKNMVAPKKGEVVICSINSHPNK